MANPDEPETELDRAALRRVLLQRLPPLRYDGGAVLAGLELDQDSDLRAAVELDADAFLAPLATTLRGRRER